MTPPDRDPTWLRLEHELRQVVDPGAYELWLGALEFRGVDASTVLVAAPDDRRRWLSERFGRVLRSAAQRVLGPDADVRFVEADGGPGDLATPAGRSAADAFAPALDEHGRPDLNPKLTFDQFVIGDANRLAHGAALAVAELPGTAYNPLFVYGPPGVGKTHLLHAIANYLVTYSPGLRVRCTTAERFTNAFTQALRGRDLDRFKGVWRASDVLLIDDVQFLESKVKTEEEFFHTFNALYDAGAQVVLTSDRLPRDMEALEDRLRERFESGLVTDIAHPDETMRLAILRKRAAQDGIELPEPGVLDAIAARITGSVRELEGALIRVVAFSSLTARPLTAALADDVLGTLYPMPATPGSAARGPTILEIQEAVCEAYGISPDELVSATRAARVSRPRQLAMYLARLHTKASLPAIGAAFGGRNHTTVMHAVRKVEALLSTDADTDEAVRSLTSRLADRRD